MMQGVSFVPLIEDPEATVRDVAFAEQNWHVFQAHQRAVRTGDFLFIQNNFPELQALNMESDPSFPAGEELWEKHAAGELNEHQKDVFQKPRPERELYQVSDDPLQLNNLAGKEEFAGIEAELEGLLDEWTETTGDSVPADPTRDRQKVGGPRDPNHTHREFPGASKNASEIKA